MKRFAATIAIVSLAAAQAAKEEGSAMMEDSRIVAPALAKYKSATIYKKPGYSPL